jgi:hypothetical protein
MKLNSHGKKMFGFTTLFFGEFFVFHNLTKFIEKSDDFGVIVHDMTHFFYTMFITLIKNKNF